MSTQAEATVLGSILLDNRLFYECGDIKPDYFALEANQQVFAAMQDLDRTGKPIDMVTLADKLDCRKEIEAVGGVSYLSSLIDGVPDRPSIRNYVDIVRDGAKRRALANSCEAILAQLQDSGNETNELIDSQENLLLRLRSAGSKGASHTKEIIPTILNEMAAQRKHKGDLVGLSTGIDGIDFTTTGIRPGEYWVVGAAPSRGKTVLGAQIVGTNAKAGVPSLVFSYEMSKEQFVKRLIPRYSGLAAGRVRDFRFASESDMASAQETAAELSQWPLWVCDPEGMNATELAAVAKLHIRRHGVKLIVVDYLQIIDGPEREIRTRVGQVSNVLRALAKSEQVSVVALSQLRRPSDENELPTMFHLKESGDIEAHAHTVLLIHRPKGAQHEWTGEDVIIVAKQREGLVGSEPVRLDSNKLAFVERPR